MRMTLAIAASVIGLVLASGEAKADYLIECSSGGYAYTYCPADTSGGVQIEQQHSSAPCSWGDSWGYDNGGVWVDQGCRGTFRIFDSGSPDYYPPGSPPPAQSSGSDADAVVGAIIALGIIAALVGEDERDGRDDGYGRADAVQACANHAANDEISRGARNVQIDSVEEVRVRGRRSYDVYFTMTSDYRRRSWTYSVYCRVKNDRVTSYARN